MNTDGNGGPGGSEEQDLQRSRTVVWRRRGAGSWSPAAMFTRSAEPIQVTPAQLISGSRNIQGWASGTPADIDDTLAFAELTGVRAMIETYPLEKAAEAYARMMSGKAEFRVVLTM